MAPDPTPPAVAGLERRVLAALRGPAGVEPGSRGLLCVSGGPDSLALLHLLQAAAGPLDLKLEVAHFDHGLRRESAREAQWVAQQVRPLGLPLHVVRTKHLAELRTGVPAAARAWRRFEARRLAAQWEATWIATGHQRDDQEETLLLKLLRGAHLTRLRGMAWRDGPWVRPLLDCSRAELCDYLRAKGQTWLEDPTNRDPAYRRNRVRHELRPLLDALATGGIARRLATLAAQSAQAQELVAAVLEAWPVPRSAPGEAPPWIDAEALRALPRLAAGSTLHDFVVTHRPGALDGAHIERALDLLHGDSTTWSLHLSHGRQVHRRGAHLLLDATPNRDAERAPVEHRFGERTVLAPSGWQVIDSANGGGVALHNLPPRARLELRHRRRGDRFQPSWRPHPVKLADFLRDQHVPLHERDRVPLVLLEGEVIAVYPRFVAHGYEAPVAGSGGTLRLEIAAL